MRAGALWNSFVIVAEPRALRGLVGQAVPALARAMAPVDARIGTPLEVVARRIMPA